MAGLLSFNPTRGHCVQTPMEKPTAPTIDTENLPPVTLETQGNLQVIRWRGMEFFHSRLDNIDWIKSLAGEYVGYSIHLGYFSTSDEIVMLLDYPLWQKFQAVMASQPGTSIPFDSCTIYGVTVKPHGEPVAPDGRDLIGAESGFFRWPTIVQVKETTCSLPNNGKTYQIQAHPQESLKVMDHSGNLVAELKPGECVTVMAPKTTVEIEKGEYERLLAVEKSYKTLCEQSRAGQ